MTELIDQKAALYREKLHGVANTLVKLTDRVNHEELHSLMIDVRDKIHDPFMFVIVGEVKVGKSSFINALLETEEDICAVAPHPMTDMIQEIVYGEEKKEEKISRYLKRVTHPSDILQQIAIVDTPGTNTIVEHHQEITERFIPVSDLIVFVFEAKNPYRQSAWDFFDFVKKDWHKKVIFVLQQKDLLPDEDLEINKNGLIDFARKKGIEEPRVFTVSALLEQKEGDHDSGFEELRTYISSNITGGKAPILKLLSHITTCRQVNRRLRDGLEDRQRQYESDLSFRDEISSTLDKHERISRNQVNVLIENLISSYDNLTSETRSELSAGLGFFSVLKKSMASIFDKEQAVKPWLENLAENMEIRLNNNMRTKLQSGVRDISDSIQQMAQIVGLKIQQSETILKGDHDVFSNIAERRANVLAELQDAFSDFLKDSENFYPKDMLASGDRMAPNVATGTGIAILGAIIAAITHGMVLDITGGVLTAIGLIFAGVSLGFNKRKILRRYDDEIKRGRIKLEDEVTEKLNHYIGWIKSRIDENFHNFDAHLEREENEIAELNQEHDEIESGLNAFEEEISKEYDIEFE